MIRLKLHEIAKRLGKTSVAIARETGINRNTIDALLKGKVSAIKFPTLEKICTTYQLDISDILELEALPVAPRPKLEITRKQYKQEGEIVPFTSWPWITVAATHQFSDGKKMYGFGPTYMYEKEDYGEFYWDLESLQALARYMYKRYSKKSQFDVFYAQFSTHAAEIADLYTTCYGLNPETMNHAQMQAIFTNIRGAYHRFWSHSLFIDAFDAGFDVETINRIAKEYGFTQDEVVTLTTPEYITFVSERKLAFLRLAKKILRGVTTRTVLKQRLKKYTHEVAVYKQSFDYHKSNYAHVKHISDEEIFQELLHYMGKTVLLKKELEELGEYTTQHTAEVKHVLKKYGLNVNPLWFFARLTYWREERKKFNTMGFHVLDLILRWVELQTGIPHKYLTYLDFDEVENVLSGLIPTAVLKKRRERGLLAALSGTTKRIFEAEEATSLKADLEASLSESNAHELIIPGQTACPGHAKGIARIILTQEDFSRFQEGEILITGMTRPEFLPVMKKASAIVTNEGGITCHAAIVSRELGIPCLIGTKNATQRIKDGELIEVRASHGTVRLLR